jgi:glycosyltransferase involved in cell wall biosynthesis
MNVFLGPTLLSGIGQVMKKYAQCLGGTFYQFGEVIPDGARVTLCFLLPVREFVDLAVGYNPEFVMTVCETEPVHATYKIIFDLFPNRVLVPSEFCRDIFKRQFGVDAHVFRHCTPLHRMNPVKKLPYVFYTIGNMNDERKNFRMILEAFERCNFGDEAALIVKSTSKDDIQITMPRVHVINGLISDESMDHIHDSGDCYINCSSSEGVGMGAVEAAIRDKPVIITDYGGLQEYVKTPFIVKTTKECVGKHDFLFEPHMIWGKPNIEDLIENMKSCMGRHYVWDHTHTRDITSPRVLLAKLANLRLELTGSPVEVHGTAAPH